MGERLRQLTLQEGRRQEAGVITNQVLEIVPVSLTDTNALLEASSPRTETDYTPENLALNYRVLPPFVGRELLRPERIKPVEDAVQEVDDFKLAIVRHLLREPLQPPYHAPVDLVGSMSYTHGGETTKISGVIMSSQLSHLAFPEIKLPPAERVALIKEHFGDYVRAMPNHNVGVVVIQKREPTSPTHRSFVESVGILNNPITGENWKRMEDKDGNHVANLYFFAHGEPGSIEQLKNIQKGQALMMDERFYQQIERLRLAWRPNFERGLETLRQEPYAQSQLIDMSNRLVRAGNK